MPCTVRQVKDQTMEHTIPRLCMGCMSGKEGDGVCPHCGFDPKAAQHPLYLRAGTRLTGRYLAGRLLGFNGEGASYLGYDLEQRRKVILREYMPDALAVRERDGSTVLALRGKETQYKALLSDFCDLHRTLQTMSTYDGLVPVQDFFERNNTAYAVRDGCADTTLAERVQRGGPIEWERLKSSLAAPFAVAEALHAMGIYHRGVSPETILARTDGGFRLGGFCIAAARTAQSELTTELFAGYSPPELYSPTGWQGAWTDVYSFAAVICFALTGKRPPEALDSMRRMTPPKIPAEVRDALNAALLPQAERRIQTIGELAGRLTGRIANTRPPIGRGADFAPPSTETVTTARGETMQTEQVQKKKEKLIKRKIRSRSLVYMLSSMFITTAILLTLMFVILGEIDQSMLVFGGEHSASVPNDQSSTAPEQEETYYLPNLVGSYLESVRNDAEYSVRYVVTETEEYNESFPAGVIFEQSPDSGTVATELVNIAVKVSKGPAPIPEDIVGMAQADAESLLKELKITYQIAEVYDTSYPAGHVAGYTRLPDGMLLKISKGGMDDGESDMDDDEMRDFLYG